MDRTGGEKDEARIEAVFRARAAELAARREQAAEPAGTAPALAFALGGERYALPLADLAGVLPLGRLTPVPGAPPELLGLINGRGRVCCVVDLARLLGLPAQPPDVPGFVVLLRRPGGAVGLRVGAVESIRRVAPRELVPVAVPGLGETAGRAADGLTLLRGPSIWGHPIFAAGESP
jgi:purine-binding chemotaxis protein CheW